MVIQVREDGGSGQGGNSGDMVIPSFIHMCSAYYVQILFWALREKQIKTPALVNNKHMQK